MTAKKPPFEAASLDARLQSAFEGRGEKRWKATG
jgi:hypothetical protein